MRLVGWLRELPIHCNYTLRNPFSILTAQFHLCVIRTPPTFPESALRSPFSLSRTSRKSTASNESEAAEALLCLSSGLLQHEHVGPIDCQCDAVDDFAVQPLSTINVHIPWDTPLSPLFFPGADSDLPSFPGPCVIDPQEFRVMSNNASPSDSEVNAESDIPRHRKPRTSKLDTILTALESLRNARISVMDLLLAILNGNASEFYSYRLAFLCDKRRIIDLLDIIWTDKKSKPAFENWLEDDGVRHVCKLISKEMEAAKPMLRMNIKDVTPQFIEQWDVNTIMDPVAAATPTWSKILSAATEPQKKSDACNPDTRNRPTVCHFGIKSIFQ